MISNIQTQFSNFVNGMGNSILGWKKRMKENNNNKKSDDLGLSVAEIKKRMAGIPIYKLSQYKDEDGDATFLSHDDDDKELKLCFVSKPDALQFFEMAKLEHYDEFQSEYCRIADTPLSDLIRLEGEGPPIRLVPESSQIKNAIQEKSKNMAETADGTFSGVPVFKSDKLAVTMKRTGTQYLPAYLRKEDLEYTLAASNISPDTIQVAALEDIVEEMKDSTTNKSNNVLFVGPGNTSWGWLDEHED